MNGMEAKKIGVILSFVQGLLIFAVYMLNPNVLLEQIGVLILAIMTFMGPSVIASTEDRDKIIGSVFEGLYIFSIMFLVAVVQYNIVI